MSAEFVFIYYYYKSRLNYWLLCRCLLLYSISTLQGPRQLSVIGHLVVLCAYDKDMTHSYALSWWVNLKRVIVLLVSSILYIKTKCPTCTLRWPFNTLRKGLLHSGFSRILMTVLFIRLKRAWSFLMMALVSFSKADDIIISHVIFWGNRTWHLHS